MVKKADETRSHLPLVIINTNGQTIVNEPKITVNIRIVDNGPGQTNGINDTANGYNGYAGIEIRGQSSQHLFPKKSYGFETRDAKGEDLKVSLLGLPEESDWVLYAPYTDKTLLRNVLSFYLGRKMGRWQPGSRFCELYLNGSYMGIYQLTEKIKRDKNRVNIKKLSSSDVSDDDVTGGYILKVDKLEGLKSTEYFTVYPDVRYGNARNYAWTWVYPEPDDLVQQQRTWMTSFVKKTENTINGTSFADPSKGYRSYLDVPSFIDFQIMNELANNVDGYRYSTYFHKNRNSLGGKLTAGPLWDFDISYGNVNYSPRNLSVDQWTYTNYGQSEANCMHWWARLMTDPQYLREVKERWTQLRRTILHTDSVMNFIDSQVQVLGDAVGRNFAKWNILGAYVWPNSAVRGSYPAEIAFLKDWITGRLEWMDSQWLLTTGIPGENSPPVACWPNPVSGTLNIGIPAGTDGIFKIYNLTGKIVYSIRIGTDRVGPFRIDVSSFPNGMYILETPLAGSGTVKTKLFKIR